MRHRKRRDGPRDGRGLRAVSSATESIVFGNASEVKQEK